MNDHALITAIWRPPFESTPPTKMRFKAGSKTLEDIVSSFRGQLPKSFDKHGEVILSGHKIEREYWARIKPKAGTKVSLHNAPQGSGGDGAKILLAVATVLTAGAASAGAFATGGLFAAKSFSATLLSGGVTFLGGLAQSAISKPPASNGREATEQQDNSPASLTGNVLSAGAGFSRVLGTRRVYPQMLTQPLVERIGEDEYAEAVFGLEGAHELSKPQFGGADMENSEDIILETRSGLTDDLPIELITRYGHQKALNVELTNHLFDSEENARLENQSIPESSLPVWAAVSTAKTADEIWLHLTMPEGLYSASNSGAQAVPIRLRIKRQDEEVFINLPELLYANSARRKVKPTIKLVFGEAPDVSFTLPSEAGWCAIYTNVAGQVSPVTDDWQAHSSFENGTGSSALYNGNEGGSKVVGVTLDGDLAVIYLDPNYFEKGKWNIEVKRGACVNLSDFNKSNHFYDGNNVDLFHYQISGQYKVLPRSRSNLADRIYIETIASVINEHPVFGGYSGSGLALMAVKVRNREMREFSIEASGLVYRWDGTAFADFGASSNCADIYHHILRGQYSAKQLPLDITDINALADWHARCDANDLTCNMVVEDAQTGELLNKVAGCGYARPSQSEQWGIIQDYDRSQEPPDQIFSARNSKQFVTSIDTNKIPDALRCVYLNDETNSDDSFLVWREGRTNIQNAHIEEIRYEGLGTEAKVKKRADFDLKQRELRAAVHSFKAPAEAIRTRNGGLIELNNLALHKTNAAARIASVTYENGAITQIQLDSEVSVYSNADMHTITDMHSVEDMKLVGLQSAIKIRRSDGTFTTHELQAQTGKTCNVILATPIIAARDANGKLPIRTGNLVTLGQAGSINLRLLAIDIQYDKNKVATIKAVDEAPEIHHAA